MSLNEAGRRRDGRHRSRISILVRCGLVEEGCGARELDRPALEVSQGGLHGPVSGQGDCAPSGMPCRAASVTNPDGSEWAPKSPSRF
jgi:hypothetical protein